MIEQRGDDAVPFSRTIADKQRDPRREPPCDETFGGGLAPARPSVFPSAMGARSNSAAILADLG
jgi:hypothetical protein